MPDHSVSITRFLCMVRKPRRITIPFRESAQPVENQAMKFPATMRKDRLEYCDAGELVPERVRRFL
jgi:hypothetical protein